MGLNAHLADRVDFVSRVRDIEDFSEQREFVQCLGVGGYGYINDATRANFTRSVG